MQSNGIFEVQRKNSGYILELYRYIYFVFAACCLILGQRVNMIQHSEILCSANNSNLIKLGHASFTGTNRLRGQTSVTENERCKDHASFPGIMPSSLGLTGAKVRPASVGLTGTAARPGDQGFFTGSDRPSDYASNSGTELSRGHASFTRRNRHRGHTSFSRTAPSSFIGWWETFRGHASFALGLTGAEAMPVSSLLLAKCIPYCLCCHKCCKDYCRYCLVHVHMTLRAESVFSVSLFKSCFIFFSCYNCVTMWHISWRVFNVWCKRERHYTLL